MSGSKQTESDGDNATDAAKTAAVEGHGAQPRDGVTTRNATKPSGHAARIKPIEVRVPNPAEGTPETLTQLADSLRNVAKHLSNKKAGSTIAVSIVTHDRKLIKAGSLTEALQEPNQVESIELKVPTSAKEMANVFSQLADDLQQTAKKPPKGKKPVITVILNCNGGGDG